MGFTDSWRVGPDIAHIWIPTQFRRRWDEDPAKLTTVCRVFVTQKLIGATVVDGRLRFDTRWWEITTESGEEFEALSHEIYSLDLSADGDPDVHLFALLEETRARRRDCAGAALHLGRQERALDLLVWARAADAPKTEGGKGRGYAMSFRPDPRDAKEPPVVWDFSITTDYIPLPVEHLRALIELIELAKVDEHERDLFVDAVTPVAELVLSDPTSSPDVVESVAYLASCPEWKHAPRYLRDEVAEWLTNARRR